jgi:hypothetical protein
MIDTSIYQTLQELPALLEAAEQRGTKILPLNLYPSRLSDPRLGRFQSINGPKRPLARLRTQAERAEVLAEASKTVEKALAERPAQDFTPHT